MKEEKKGEPLARSGLPGPAGQADPAADYVWAGWGRPGRCLPVDGESVGSYECAFCERVITRDMTLEQADAPCPGRQRSETLNGWFAL